MLVKGGKAQCNMTRLSGDTTDRTLLVNHVSTVAPESPSIKAGLNNLDGKYPFEKYNGKVEAEFMSIPRSQT